MIPHKHDSTVKDHWWDASHISLVLLYKSKTFELSRGSDLLPPPPIDPRMYPINKILKNPNKHTQHVTVKCCTSWKPNWHCTGASLLLLLEFMEGSLFITYTVRPLEQVYLDNKSMTQRKDFPIDKFNDFVTDTCAVINVLNFIRNILSRRAHGL